MSFLGVHQCSIRSAYQANRSAIRMPIISSLFKANSAISTGSRSRRAPKHASRCDILWGDDHFALSISPSSVGGGGTVSRRASDTPIPSSLFIEFATVRQVAERQFSSFLSGNSAGVALERHRRNKHFSNTSLLQPISSRQRSATSKLSLCFSETRLSTNLSPLLA